MSQFLATLAVISAIACIAGFALVRVQNRLTYRADDVVETINNLLPKTQCAQCGYPGCRPYAEAIAIGEAINLCPPGGDTTIIALADLLGKPVLPLDDSLAPVLEQTTVTIREADCIGCKLCIEACPVDAIIGTTKMMHTVIESHCTGCDLCIPACPVDCIDVVNLGAQPLSPMPEVPVPCIHCGDCAVVCPRELAPQQLLMAKHEIQLPATLRLQDCIECRLCDRVCPSEIALTDTFKSMKSLIAIQQQERQLATEAEQRFTHRENRRSIQSQVVKGRPADVSALLSSIGDDL